MIVLPKFTENGIFVSITSWSYTFVPFNGWKQKKVRNKLMCFEEAFCRSSDHSKSKNSF